MYHCTNAIAIALLMQKVHFTTVGPLNKDHSWYFYECIYMTSSGYFQQLKLVMDSIIWAFRHTERNIAETGLNLLLEMLKNFKVYLGLLIFL